MGGEETKEPRPLRACLKSGLCSKMLALGGPDMWRAQAGATLSYGSHWGGMDPLSTAHSRRQTWWSPAYHRHARGGQCYPLQLPGFRATKRYGHREETAQ